MRLKKNPTEPGKKGDMRSASLSVTQDSSSDKSPLKTVKRRTASLSRISGVSVRNTQTISNKDANKRDSKLQSKSSSSVKDSRGSTTVQSSPDPDLSKSKNSEKGVPKMDLDEMDDILNDPLSNFELQDTIASSSKILESSKSRSNSRSRSSTSDNQSLSQHKSINDNAGITQDSRISRNSRHTEEDDRKSKVSASVGAVISELFGTSSGSTLSTLSDSCFSSTVSVPHKEGVSDSESKEKVVSESELKKEEGVSDDQTLSASNLKTSAVDSRTKSQKSLTGKSKSSHSLSSQLDLSKASPKNSGTSQLIVTAGEGKQTSLISTLFGTSSGSSLSTFSDSSCNSGVSAAQKEVVADSEKRKEEKSEMKTEYVPSDNKKSSPTIHQSVSKVSTIPIQESISDASSIPIQESVSKASSIPIQESVSKASSIPIEQNASEASIIPIQQGVSKVSSKSSSDEKKQSSVISKLFGTSSGSTLSTFSDSCSSPTLSLAKSGTVSELREGRDDSVSESELTRQEVFIDSDARQSKVKKSATKQLSDSKVDKSALDRIHLKKCSSSVGAEVRLEKMQDLLQTPMSDLSVGSGKEPQPNSLFAPSPTRTNASTDSSNIQTSEPYHSDSIRSESGEQTPPLDTRLKSQSVSEPDEILVETSEEGLVSPEPVSVSSVSQGDEIDAPVSPNSDKGPSVITELFGTSSGSTLPTFPSTSEFSEEA